LHGLSSAIEVVHNLTVQGQQYQDALTLIGYHHDIRPKNILVTQSTFVLADFGLARFKHVDADSRTQWKLGIGDYVSPECMDDDFNALKVGRSMDIWAFGCLISEIATYMEEGPSGVKKFQANRVFKHPRKNLKNSRFFQETELNHAVLPWFEKLNTTARDDTIRCLTQISKTMLQVREKDRANAKQSCQRLSFISCKASFRAIMERCDIVLSRRMNTKQNLTVYAEMDIQFCVNMLKSWGSVLEMHADQIDCYLFKRDSSLGDALKRILQQLSFDVQNLDNYSLEKGGDFCEALDYQTTASLRKFPGIQSMRQSIQSLFEVVPQVYQKRMAQQCQLVFLNDKDEEALQIIEDSAKDSHSPHSDIGAFAALKRLEMALLKEATDLKTEQKKLILRPWQITFTETIDETHALGYFTSYDPSASSMADASQDQEQAFIEWMTYTPVWGNVSDEERILKMTALTELLHYPKPAGFRVLTCIGFIPPTAEFGHGLVGFVYALPAHARAFENPKVETLLQRIQARRHTPLLEEKFNIAKCLTSSIFELHSAGWLHKNISSSILIFFEKANDVVTRLNHGPYLMGLYHSRPDGETWLSESASDVRTKYHHPQYEHGTNRFKKIYDYYSVGIVLLEIGFWRPISTFRAHGEHESGLSFQNLLIEKYAPKLGSSMGSLYRDVVVSCLRGSFENNHEESTNQNGLVRFYWAVVARLMSCKID
jgi:serine/threonine protein kinase